jgi:hypothetical protein
MRHSGTDREPVRCERCQERFVSEAQPSDEDWKVRSIRGRTAGQTRMEDVARRVGVSIVTVSRTLHQPEKVSEKTRRRVLRAIAATGYVENLVAGSLASNRTNVIAAIVPTLSNPAYGMSVHAVSEVLRKNGLHLLLGTSGTVFSCTDVDTHRRPDVCCGMRVCRLSKRATW